jgi:hypothetical protein
MPSEEEKVIQEIAKKKGVTEKKAKELVKDWKMEIGHPDLRTAAESFKRRFC